jgi:hypothetical protein
MTSFLFWNINKKPLQSTIRNLVTRYDIDVLMLAECNIASATMLDTLNTDTKIKYHYAPGIGCEKIQIYARFENSFINPIRETSRLTIRRVTLPGITEFLLSVVHLPSKMHWSDESLASECVNVSEEIKRAESEAQHKRTILVGDFNMNPFESGVVSANGLHAVMSKDIAQRGNRTVLSKSYPFFYNPMWSLFGDLSSGPPGTYYYANSQQRVYFWNMFDQVMVRPDLLPFFSLKDLEIIQIHEQRKLKDTDEIVIRPNVSDHFPLRFKLNL